MESKKKEFPDGIPRCGSDALRFALLAYMTTTGDINLNIENIISNRNMCNKVWNTVKFAAYVLGDFEPDLSKLDDF